MALSPADLDDTLVSFRDVHKTYDGRHMVVKSLNLAIRRGEFLTLLGPSGSGKTTSLMMLAGFESPSSGEIMLGNEPLTTTPPHKRNFGMVFQNYALFPHMTVAQNVAYPLTVRRVPAAEQTQRVARALAMVQLVDMDARYPSQLSGGQQQRVALARALVFDPQLVLMDEPLGALDKQLREHMQIELKALHRQLGVTFLFVTHDQGEALTMSDRVAVFNDGVIQQIDAADRLYEEPANRFVAGFIGDNTQLDGVLEGPGQADDSVSVATLLLPSGEQLAGINVNEAAPGARVSAFIRPERIVVQSSADPGSKNCLRARVDDRIYFGDHVRLRCTIDGQPQATVKLGLSSSELPRVGDNVLLTIDPVFVRIYS